MSVLAIAISLALSGGAAAEGMSKDAYQVEKNRIGSSYKGDRVGCKSMSGHAKDICVAEAKGKRKVATAELEATYKPSDKARYDARAAKAEAEYSIAKERCDDKAANAKAVCMKEARAAMTTAKADAAEANRDANQASTQARAKAN